MKDDGNPVSKSRDLLFPGGSARAGVSAATSQATIRFDDVEYWATDVVELSRRLPQRALRVALHEWRSLQLLDRGRCGPGFAVGEYSCEAGLRPLRRRDVSSK